MVTAKYKMTPPMLDDCMSFDVYMTKLSVWASTMPLLKAQLGALVAASILNKAQGIRNKKYLQDKLFEQIKGNELTSEEGIDKVKEWLQKELGGKVLYKCVRVWREFEARKQKPDEKAEEYLDRFERCFGRVKASCGSAKIPEEILAFMVFERADVDETWRMLILSKMNLEKKYEMFNDMCK